MEKEFWLSRWNNNEIAFHSADYHKMLLTHFTALSLTPGARVFVPLCGKTLDIGWLLVNGYHVVGVELIELAVEQLFDQLKIKPAKSQTGKLAHYSAEGIDIFLGDIFEVKAEAIGTVNAVYDRAALVALPKEVRKSYATHLLKLTNHAPQLLITYEYDQKLLEGPPFAVAPAELKRLYGSHYNLTKLETAEKSGRFKTVAATENIWLLKTKNT